MAAQGDSKSAAADSPTLLDEDPTTAAAAKAKATLPAPQPEMPPDAAPAPADGADAAPKAADGAVRTATKGALAAGIAPVADGGAEAVSGSRATDSTADQSLDPDGNSSHLTGAAAVPNEAGGEVSKDASAEADVSQVHGSRSAADDAQDATNGLAGSQSVAEQRASGVQQARLRAEAAMAESVLAHVRRAKLHRP